MAISLTEFKQEDLDKWGFADDKHEVACLEKVPGTYWRVRSNFNGSPAFAPPIIHLDEKHLGQSLDCATLNLFWVLHV